MSPSTPATKRACDACHRRKVRCNGSNPCQNCEQASLACTYNKPPQKKGPKGHRAKVISELRESQEIKTDGSVFRDGHGIESPLTSPVFFRQSELLSHDLAEACISHFFENMYTTLPIMHRGWMEDRAREMRGSPESYCLVGSLCAYMVIQPGIRLPSFSGTLSPDGATPRQQAVSQGIRILETIKRVWVTIDHPDNVTTATILTCFFLSAGNFGIERQQRAWYWLQEAMVFGRMLRIHDEKTYQQGNPNDTMNRRLFWLLFITERAQALHKHRDLTFHESIEFPKPEADPVEDLGISGLTCLYNLFRIVDDNVSEIWNKLRSEDTMIFWPPNTAMWLSQLQQQLITAIPTDMKYTEIQEADIEITRAWLRSIVWQLSTASRCLSSASADQSMTLIYPIHIVSDLVSVTARLPPASMEAHGLGLIEKLFDITCTLIDVLAVVTLETAPFEYGPRYYLSHLLHLIETLGGGETRFGALLEAKIRDTPRANTVLALATGPLSSSSNPSLNGMPSSLEGGSVGSHPSTPTVGSPTVLAGLPQLTASPSRFQIGGYRLSNGHEFTISVSQNTAPAVN